LTLNFGSLNESFIKPLPRTKINLLSFAYISNDLYKIEKFVSESLGFESVSIGNRGFKLFQDVNVEEL